MRAGGGFALLSDKVTIWAPWWGVYRSCSTTGQVRQPGFLSRWGPRRASRGAEGGALQMDWANVQAVRSGCPGRLGETWCSAFGQGCQLDSLSSWAGRLSSLAGLDCWLDPKTGQSRWLFSAAGEPPTQMGGVASLPGCSAQALQQQEHHGATARPLHWSSGACSTGFQADPMWSSPADSPGVPSGEALRNPGQTGCQAQALPPRKTWHRGTLSVWHCASLGEGWSKGNHVSHPANVALLSFVVQGVLPPPCWDLEFSHS